MSIQKLPSKLKIYAKEGYNVLLTGRHGVGKTAIIKEVFEECFGEHYAKWRYFSASTLDPWVDFIGIPKNYTRPDGKEVFTIIPPEHFSGDEEIEAIFFDEINRADEKVLNALMELIQFKSINGRKFPHLKCVWGAENPATDDNEYSVKPLDPAQKDRFQIQIVVPEELNVRFFSDKYGSETANISAEWWHKNKNKISPRKLDDILLGYSKGFDLNDFSTATKMEELQHSLDSIAEYRTMLEVAKTATAEEKKNYFTLDKLRKNENIIKKNKDKEFFDAILDHLDEEVLAYMKKEYKLGPDKTLIGVSEETKKFLSASRSLQKTWFMPDEAGKIGEYIISFNLHFKYSAKDFDSFEACSNVNFPFKFTTQLSTVQIRELLTNLNKMGVKLMAIKQWFVSSMYMLTEHANSQKVMEKIELYKIMVKLAGNRDFVKAIGLNKIHFNEWKSWKNVLETFEEMKKRQS